jgi:hypothetical protein
MKLGVTNIQTLNQLLIYDDFDLKLQEFKWRMMVQVVGILMPLLAFSMVYNHSKA